MTEIEANKLVAMLFATFPGAKVEPRKQPDGSPTPGGGTSGVYARLLRDLDYELAVAAVARVAATFKFSNLLPTVAEIREAAAELSVGHVAPGGTAWGAVLGLLRPTRAHRGYHAADPPPREVVEQHAGPIGWLALQAIGGWRVLCCADENDPAPRAQFVRAYDGLAASHRRDIVANTLPAVASYLALRGGDARRAITDSDDRLRSDDAWAAPSHAGELVAGLAKRIGGGGS